MVRAKPNTQNDTKTRRIPRHNIHLEKNLFACFSDFVFYQIALCIQSNDKDNESIKNKYTYI